MIDQLALEAACQEFKEWLYIPGKVEKEERAAINAAIRAYEAALWRPIEEAPRDGSWILVWVEDYTFPPGMIQWRDEAWVDNGLDCWDLDFLLKERAIFRTIAPPSPASTPPAAEDDK